MDDLTDSELISLYHEGKMDGESMNRLERRALDDPFLADALEGFARAKKPHIIIKKDLQKRLGKRLHKNKRRGIIGQTAAWAAAAAIVLAVGATWFWFQEEKNIRLVHQGPVKPLLPLPRNDTAKQAIVSEVPLIAAAPPEKETAKTASHLRIKKDPDIIELPDSVILGNVAVVAYNAAPARTKMAFSPAMADSMSAVKADDALQKEEPAAAMKGANRAHKFLLKGKVVSGDNGKALPGVNLVLQGKRPQVVSDAEGKFSIAADTNDVIYARYIGYRTAEKRVTKTDSLIIVMQPEEGPVSEVVSIGYGKNIPAKRAQPAGGWKAYREYLDKATGNESGSDRNGSVLMEFTVDSSGLPADFILVKPANATLAERAKNILKNGPKWQRGTALNERIRISLRFKTK